MVQPTSAPSGQSYASKTFVLPLTVTVDPVVLSPASVDSSNVLSWDAWAVDGSAVRFLVPVEVYSPGSSRPEAPPKDFLAYVQGVTKAKAVISNVGKISVDGHPATLMDLTWNIDARHPEGYFDGAFGCPVLGADRSFVCFGPAPYLLQRLAVVDVGGTTLLAWAQVDRHHPDQSFVTMFEHMLTTVRFH